MRAERRAGRIRALVAPAVAVGLALASAGPVAAQPDDEPHTVAVLPFAVYSAKPIDYLGESLSNLVRSRLEARGDVRVLPPSAVRALAKARATDAELRRIAGDLGADTVVTGSLTELAGHYSLDVRVTPAAIGLRSHTLVLTAQRDEELLERINELADQVLEQVVGAEPAQVADVELLGPQEIVDAMRTRMRTKAGSAFDPATIRDDLAMLRATPEVANADAETERGAEGVAVRFRIVGSQRIFTESGATEVEGARVAEVRIRGNRRIEADAIQARIKTRAGSLYSPAQIAKDLAAVHSLGFFSNVRVFRERSDEGLVVIFSVEENPVVRQISISGNENIAGDDIRDILTLTTGSSLDYPLIYENRARIEGLYKGQGYYLAEVTYEIAPLGEASVSIDFIVNENEKLKLRSIDFVGNEVFSDSELRQGFQSKVWHFWSYATSWFDRSGTYSEPLFIQDLRLAEKKYYEDGYLQVQIGLPKVDASPEGLTVVVEIDEGEQFRVGGIDVAGDAIADIDELRENLQLKEGEIFNRTFLTEDVEALKRHYTERGFFLADVAPLSDLSEDDRVVDVIFQVRKGPLYFIREIGISGNTRTVDPVVRREVPLVEGQLYSSRSIQIARARLERLGFFEEVEMRPEPTDDAQELDLEVEVVERPTGSFSFGAGFSSQDSFVLTGSLAESNLFGRGYAMNLNADVGARSQRFFMQFVDPYFLGSNFSLSTTLFRTDVRFEDFEQTQTGASFVFGHALTEDNRTRGFARYNIQSRDVQQDSNVNAAGIIFREILAGAETSSSVGLSFEADYRNDRLSPNEGFQLGGALEFAGLGFFSRYLRVEGRGAYYLKAPWWMPDRSTFVLRASFGYALPFNNISDFNFDVPTGLVSADGQVRSLDEIDTNSVLPLSERYFLGGLGQFQLRGFKSRSVGPRRPIVTRVANAGIFPGLPLETPIYAPVGYDIVTGGCAPPGFDIQGDDDGVCNDITADELDEISDLDETDVIGGNKFISSSVEYRFPISDTIGLQGILFLDTGNAFAEGDNPFDITQWRWGTGAGVQWFSPFGPLTVILGFPLDPLSIEDSPVFEFSVGSGGF